MIDDVGPELNDAQIDAIVNNAQSSEPTSDIFPMDNSGEQAQAQAPAQAQGQEAAQAQAQAQDQFVITHNGKQVQATLDQLKQWAQMGYDYPQRMQALKQQQAEYEKQWSIYKEIDSYAKENPQWWQHVDSQWRQRAANLTPQQAGQLDPSNPLAQAYQSLQQEIADLKGFKQSLEQEKQIAQRQKEDETLNSEVQSMREQFKHLDWGSLDSRGYDLEMQVLAFAQERGVPSFEQAFKLYNYDRLMSLAEERGKEAVVKDQQKKTKLGLLGQPNPAPTGKVTQARSIKEKSYNDLAKEALEELGITG